MVIERFAPSPTGLLHLGHAYSAWVGWQAAREAGGQFLLRMEDLDASRVRPEYYAAIERDLRWLGMDWDGAVMRQSARTAAYVDALTRLEAMGLTYHCTCTRRDIAEAASAPQEGTEPLFGPDGLVYPGTCRGAARDAALPHAVRLNMREAIEHLGGPVVVAELQYSEIGEAAGDHHLSPEALTNAIGDVVLSRRDGAVAYHLAVVVDDGFQGVTHVTRGADLASATPIHRLLQALLDLPVPVYRHHRLIRDEAGKRLAKRDDARSIPAYREAGMSPEDVLALTRPGQQSGL